MNEEATPRAVSDVPLLGERWRLNELTTDWQEVAAAFEGEGPTLSRCQLVDAAVTWPGGGPALRERGHAHLTFILFDHLRPAARRPDLIAALEISVHELHATRWGDVVVDEVGAVHAYADVDRATGRGSGLLTVVYLSASTTVLCQGTRIHARLSRRLPALSTRRPPRTAGGQRDITLVLREAAGRRTPGQLGGSFGIVRALLRPLGRFAWERDDDGWHRIFQDDVLTAWVHSTAPLVVLFPPAADRTYADALADIPVIDCHAPDSPDLVADRDALDALADPDAGTPLPVGAAFSPKTLTTMLFRARDAGPPVERVRVYPDSY